MTSKKEASDDAESLADALNGEMNDEEISELQSAIHAVEAALHALQSENAALKKRLAEDKDKRKEWAERLQEGINGISKSKDESGEGSVRFDTVSLFAYLYQKIDSVRAELVVSKGESE